MVSLSKHVAPFDKLRVPGEGGCAAPFMVSLSNHDRATLRQAQGDRRGGVRRPVHGELVEPRSGDPSTSSGRPERRGCAAPFMVSLSKHVAPFDKLRVPGEGGCAAPFMVSLSNHDRATLRQAQGDRRGWCAAPFMVNLSNHDRATLRQAQGDRIGWLPIELCRGKRRRCPMKGDAILKPHSWAEV